MTYIPLVAALIILLLPRLSDQSTRWLALTASALSFLVSLVMLVSFRPTAPGMQFEERVAWLPEIGLSYHLGVDGISVLLVVLTALLQVIAITASWGPIQRRVREYYISMLLLGTGMIGVFISLDLFLFYIFWEVVLIPMALLIGIWGSANRVYAAVKFFLYTLAGSLLMLVGIVVMYETYYRVTGRRSLDVLDMMAVIPQMPLTYQVWVFLAFFIAFAIKVPMWPFHTWLPDAHVQAPTAGSVILAGVLLKMGGYGMLRFNLPLFPAASRELAFWVLLLSTVAIIYGALVALVQPDLKRLIAYTSVSHMGFVTLGIFALNQQGLEGAMIVMLSHGFVTGALFLLVGVIYERAHTREISHFGGLATRMPVYASLFGLFMFSSIGLPGLSGFIGEYLTILGAFTIGPFRWMAVVSMLVIILAAFYMMWLYQRFIFGSESDNVRGYHDVTRLELATLAPLVVLTVALGVFPGPVFAILHGPVQALLAGVPQLAMR
ncbi:MAG: NADH-quinone oxidoreductase subunit M [Chloroflexi bacterium]|nr:NADH-quinone oxidoreductase subunit M [Chloroflexota bacterium]